MYGIAVAQLKKSEVPRKLVMESQSEVNCKTEICASPDPKRYQLR